MNRTPSPIRVVRVIARLNIGGPALHVTLLNEGLNRKGYETWLVCGNVSKTEGDSLLLAREKQIRTVVLEDLGREISLFKDVGVILKLWKIFRECRPHIVHTHTAKAGFVGRVAALLAGTPVVMHTFHGHVFHSYFGPLKTAFFKTLERICACWTDAVIVISERQKKEIASFHICPEKKMEVVPLGLDLDRFDKTPRGNGSFRHSCGVENGVRLIGIIGRIVPVKRHDLFVAAAARLVAAGGAAWRFVVVGDGEERCAIEKMLENEGLAKHFILTGWRRDLEAIYSDLDVSVICSDNEGTPVSLVESMSSGCPVVSTAVGGVADLLGDGIFGRLCPPGDSVALAKKIEEVFLDADGTREKVSLAKSHVLEKYAASRLVEDVDRLCRRVLKEKGLLPN